MSLAKTIIAHWPAALPVKLISAEGDTLTLEVCRGSWSSNIRIKIGDYDATLEDSGVIWETIDGLLKSDDIDFLIDRYAVTFERENRLISVMTATSHGNWIWRVYELYLFVQACADYATGIESEKFQQLIPGVTR